MDKRIMKTKRDIREAFLSLRSKTALNKIKVSELCEIAMVNKSTFYKYYEDIIALSNEIEDVAVDAIIDDFECIDELFSNPQNFLNGLLAAISKHENSINIKILFIDNINELVRKIEVHLKKYYLSESKTVQKDIEISFLIGGATYAMLNTKYDKATIKIVLEGLLCKFV